MKFHSSDDENAVDTITLLNSCTEDDYTKELSSMLKGGDVPEPHSPMMTLFWGMLCGDILRAVNFILVGIYTYTFYVLLASLMECEPIFACSAAVIGWVLYAILTQFSYFSEKNLTILGVLGKQIERCAFFGVGAFANYIATYGF